MTARRSKILSLNVLSVSFLILHVLDLRNRLVRNVLNTKFNHRSSIDCSCFGAKTDEQRLIDILNLSLQHTVTLARYTDVFVEIYD